MVNAQVILPGEEGQLGSKGNKGFAGFPGFFGEHSREKGSRGRNGNQGPSGESGTPGFPGFEGDIGEDGLVGFKGFQGNEGRKGERGAPGPQGRMAQFSEFSRPTAGRQGEKGYRGDFGFHGEPGEPGILTGAQGETGEKGIQGPRGQRGDVGEAGFKGPDGTGPKGFKGEAPKGFEGEAGTKGERGDVGESGEVGEAGDVGESGDVGLKGRSGSQGKRGTTSFVKGEPGDRGTKGEQGPTGFHGFTGRQGPQGQPGQQGPVGDEGPEGAVGPGGPNGVTGSASGHLIVRHSQNAFIPTCPKNYEIMWEGYSLMYTVGNGYAHSQDLGDAGSCSKSFSTLPFLFCGITGTCQYASRNDFTYWLAGDVRQPMMPVANDAVEPFISRCVVCQAPDINMAVHSQDVATPSCPTGYDSLWTGFSFMMVAAAGNTGAGQSLGSSGSCLEEFRPKPFIECQGARGSCHFFSDKFSFWLTTIEQRLQFTVPSPQTLSATKGDDLTSRVSRCRVCIRKNKVSDEKQAKDVGDERGGFGGFFNNLASWI